MIQKQVKFIPKPEDHKNLSKKGYTHVDPKILIKILAGWGSRMEPFESYKS